MYLAKAAVEVFNARGVCLSARAEFLSAARKCAESAVYLGHALYKTHVLSSLALAVESALYAYKSALKGVYSLLSAGEYLVRAFLYLRNAVLQLGDAVAHAAQRSKSACRSLERAELCAYVGNVARAGAYLARESGEVSVGHYLGVSGRERGQICLHIREVSARRRSVSADVRGRCGYARRRRRNVGKLKSRNACVQLVDTAFQRIAARRQRREGSFVFLRKAGRQRI